MQITPSSLETLKEKIKLLSLTEIDSLAHWPADEAAQLARMLAAQEALNLAATLLDGHDPDQAQPIWDTLTKVRGNIKQWRRKQRGWFEVRSVKRPRLAPVYDAEGNMVKDEEGKPFLKVVMVPFGPYRYYRWRDETGKLQCFYLGRDDQYEKPPSLDDLPALYFESFQGEEVLSSYERLGPLNCSECGKPAIEGSFLCGDCAARM